MIYVCVEIPGSDNRLVFAEYSERVCVHYGYHCL